ncbi:MAG: (4Fe-4S)-binding protein [Clostridiales bacterium]|nr:(4Fe-4S)-binding protein [Clostridiales bacterium]
MKNYVLLVDIEKCTQCYGCVLACKDEHFGNDFPPVSAGCKELGQNWIGIGSIERGSGDKVFVDCWPELCRHCEDPECVKASGAVYKRDDGIVIIDPLKAKGEEALAGSCPHGAISFNDEKGLPQKCTLCAHLLDAGEAAPRCVEACPTSALLFGDLGDPDSEAARVVCETPELAGQSGVVRYSSRPGRFAAGSVYLSRSEVAEGAKVQLLCGGEPVMETLTNGFGDFRFDRLPGGTQEGAGGGAVLQIKISLDGYETALLDLGASGDVCWDEIVLARAQP